MPLWYQEMVVLGGPIAVQLRTKDMPILMYTSEDMDSTLGRSGMETSGMEWRHMWNGMETV